MARPSRGDLTRGGITLISKRDCRASLCRRRRPHSARNDGAWISSTNPFTAGLCTWMKHIPLETSHPEPACPELAEGSKGCPSPKATSTECIPYAAHQHDPAGTWSPTAAMNEVKHIRFVS